MQTLRPGLRLRRERPRLSVIVPVYREAEGVVDGLRWLLGERPDEVVVVDGASEDGTAAAARGCQPAYQAAGVALQVIDGPRGRAAQMNAGAAVASGEQLLFLHVDTRLRPGALERLRLAYRAGGDAGWFALQLDNPRWLATATAWLATQRAALSRVATGDMGIYCSRALFERVGGYPLVPLMEDVLFCQKLHQGVRLIRLREPAITSARRWELRGWWPTILMMWSFRALHYFGASPEWLAERYPPVR